MKGTIWLDDDGKLDRITLDDPTALALSEIADPRMHQRDVAQTIAFALEAGQRDELDWPAISDAASRRWSTAGWVRIKRLAWTGKCWPQEREEAQP